MPNQPSNEGAACLARATECELEAQRSGDPAAKQFFLDFAARWRRIAATYEYIEQVDRFVSRPKA